MSQTKLLRFWRAAPVLRLPTAAASLLALMTCGCGPADPPRVPVFKTAGKISFQGRPIEGAFVALHPRGVASIDAPRPTANVKPDGSFEATTFESADGAPSGEYVVTVHWHRLINEHGEWKPGPNLLPARYSSVATSGIVVRVAEGTNELPPIALR